MTKNRILAFFLIITLLVSMLPMPAFATDTTCKTVTEWKLQAIGLKKPPVTIEYSDAEGYRGTLTYTGNYRTHPAKFLRYREFRGEVCKQN
ncbi:hypothetical protein [Caldalkalibacillus mannanilyticus]|uniref:hypothetical protein n=1 Tax=Caldalkalibacillus mannanilyticus TaxID=1418 RepID=UPI00046A722A|nr:hypothetical protein [Caldalkalibacillus mannanilyticus]